MDSHNGYHSNTIRKQLRTIIIITTLLCTHYLCSWLIPCSSVSPPVSAAPPTLQTEVEESSRPPSSNVRPSHSEDWEHHLLWWGVHSQEGRYKAGFPVQRTSRHVVTASHLSHSLLWSHPAGWEASDSGR